MGGTWLTNGGIFNSWEELGRKSYGWKNLNILLLIYSTHIKIAQQGWSRWECLQYASTSCFIIVWASPFSPLLGRTRSRGRCWVANRLSLIIRSRQAVQSMGRSMVWSEHWKTTWSTVWSSSPHSQAQKRPYPICANWSANVRHRFGGGWAGPTLFLAGLSQKGGRE